jgi:UDP-4-amino-4,6-dideoxy-N-acetyl-beta-L-altrosamine transaminase
MIPYGRQDITAADIEAVREVLQSDFLTQGPAVPAFEAAVAAQVGVAHAVAVNSATSALHLACLALGLGPGRSLWTTPNTFVASANCARYCGADVDFVDIDPATGNMSVADLEARLLAAERAGRLPSVVVPVDFSGQPVDGEAIGALARGFGFRVIDDASHAIGARTPEGAVGSGTWADITIFSFHPVKIVTTAEGGMAVTADAALAAHMARLRTHGITRDPDLMQGRSRGAWYYEQLELGFNYRLTDLQAALGLSQLSRLEAYVAQRAALAARYDTLLADLPVIRPQLRPGVHSAWHLYVVRIPATVAARDEVFTRMRAAGIGVNVHYAPVHLQPYYRGLGFMPGWCPEAEQYGEQALTLPLFPTMSEGQQDAVVDALRSAVR